MKKMKIVALIAMVGMVFPMLGWATVSEIPTNSTWGTYHTNINAVIRQSNTNAAAITANGVLIAANTAMVSATSNRMEAVDAVLSATNTAQNIRIAAVEGGSVALSFDQGDNSGDHSVAIGYGSATAEDDAIAIGTSTTSDSIEAIAIGYYAEASADYNISIGSDSVADGNDEAIALGHFAYASANGSIAIGADADAGGVSSISLGYTADAGGAGAMALGRYGDSQFEDAFAWSSTSGHASTTNHQFYIYAATSILLDGAATEVENATADGHAMNRTTADGRYLQSLLCELTFTNGLSQLFTNAAGYEIVVGLIDNVVDAGFTTASSRITVADAGRYNVQSSLSYSTASASELELDVFTNGVELLDLAGQEIGWSRSTTVSAADGVASCSRVVTLVAGTVVDLRIDASDDETVTWHSGNFKIEKR